MLGKCLIFLSHKLNSLCSQPILMNAKIRLALVVVHTYVFVAPINLMIYFGRHYGTCANIITVIFR